MEDARQVYISEHSKRLCEITRVGFISHLSRRKYDWTATPKNPEDEIPASDRNGRCVADISTRLDSQEMVIRSADGRVLCSYSTNNGNGTFVDDRGDSQSITMKEAVLKTLRIIYAHNEEYN